MNMSVAIDFRVNEKKLKQTWPPSCTRTEVWFLATTVLMAEAKERRRRWRKTRVVILVLKISKMFLVLGIEGAILVFGWEERGNGPWMSFF